jgi:hypothetical protein
VRIAGSQSCAQKITFVGQTEQRVIADLVGITVKRCTLLVSVHGIFGGIYIDDEPPFVSAPKEGVGGPADGIFKGFQTLACCENLVLEPAECGLAGAASMFFTQGQPKCRVYSQVIGVIAIVIACRNLIDSLTKQLEHRMIRMAMRSWVINLGGGTTENVEPLIDLPDEKKTRIAGDLCALKINADEREGSHLHS